MESPLKVDLLGASTLLYCSVSKNVPSSVSPSLEPECPSLEVSPLYLVSATGDKGEKWVVGPPRDFVYLPGGK